MKWGLIGVAVAIGLASPSTAVSAPSGAQSNAFVGGFSAISTSDMDRALDWWRSVLRFEVIRDFQRSDGRLRAVLLSRGDHLLELVEREEAIAGGPPPVDASYRLGIFKTGFFVEDIDAFASELRTRGARFQHEIVRPPESRWRTFAIQDPDGNIVQVFGP